MNLKANFHTHSLFCDGKSTPRESVEQALRLGFTQLGFSGHMDADIHMDMDAYTREIRALEAEYRDRIEILCGVELDNLYDPACSEGLDYIIGSTHFLDAPYERLLSVDDTVEDMVFLCREFFGGDYYKLSRRYFELVAQTYDKLRCTFIGHFDLVTKFNAVLHGIDEEDKRYLAPAFEAMEYLVSEGVPFEINTRQAHRGKLFPGPILLKRLRELGGEILINSDAHAASELNAGFELAVETARACGFDHTNLLTKRDGTLRLVPLGL